MFGVKGSLGCKKRVRVLIFLPKCNDQTSYEPKSVSLRESEQKIHQ